MRHYNLVFSRIMYAIHPGGIEVEVPGKSANVNWGARAAYAYLERTLGPAAVDRMAITVADCDAKVSEHYFNELSVNFAAAALDKREVFWAPPMLFDEAAAECAMEAAAAAELEEVDGSITPMDHAGGGGGAGAAVPAPQLPPPAPAQAAVKPEDAPPSPADSAEASSYALHQHNPYHHRYAQGPAPFLGVVVAGDDAAPVADVPVPVRSLKKLTADLVNAKEWTPGGV